MGWCGSVSGRRVLARQLSAHGSSPVGQGRAGVGPVPDEVLERGLEVVDGGSAELHPP